MAFSYILIILGLVVFEVISSIDNAIVNAHILKTLPEKYRKIFLVWGLFLAVFVVRGLLPFIIVWLVNTDMSFVQLWHVVFSNDPSLLEDVERSKPILLLGGGIYLFLVFLSWLFLEEKKYAFLVEHFVHRQGMWFYAIASFVLTGSIYAAININPILALSAAIGASAFFLTDGFKKNAEEKEKDLLNPGISAWSKILYLEAIDASFSIDGVIGAFAFTISVPLILIGNGIGAFVVREITIRGVDTISKFAYLKNGAMYSIGFLGALMMLESFGKHFPIWVAPLNTILLLLVFLFLSWREINMEKEAEAQIKNIQ
ncbi:DUF475 domain-containing protein [Candidatus Falkowbacteria bacterium]|nr:DUF475 domain-containing protein [Candidatus Falkowbacteria bacterium]